MFALIEASIRRATGEDCTALVYVARSQRAEGRGYPLVPPLRGGTPTITAYAAKSKRTVNLKMTQSVRGYRPTALVGRGKISCNYLSQVLI